MADVRPTALQMVRATLSDEWALRRRARELGVVVRQGRLDSYALLCAVVLGVAVRGPTAIAVIGRVLSEVSGHRFARSSVFCRFNKPFRDLVQSLLDDNVRRARARDFEVPGVLSGFKDVLVADATVLKVDDSLEGTWKATRRNSMKAALKVHAWVRAFTGELVKYKLTPDAYGDGRAFGIDQQLRGCLMLFDRAYSSPSLWRRIDGVGGFFLTRLTLDRDPEIVEVLRTHAGRARKLEGRRLRDALAGLKREYVDVEATFRCRVRKYHGKRTNRWVVERFRLVAVRRRNGTYMVYVTNAPPSLLPAEAIVRTYRLRWEVETFFKTSKSGSGLNELPSSKQHIVETFVFAALLRATTSMQALAAVRRDIAEPQGLAINPGQWQKWWNRQLRGFLEELLPEPLALSATAIATMLADPNVGRPTNRHTFLACAYLA